MTAEQIRSAILADRTLKAKAIAGADAEIAKALSPASDAPALTVTAMIGLISAESAAKLAVNPNVTDLRDKVKQGDLEAVTVWAQLFAKGGVITANEYQAVAAAIQQAAASVREPVSAEQVSTALQAWRVDGRAGQANWTGG